VARLSAVVLTKADDPSVANRDSVKKWTVKSKKRNADLDKSEIYNQQLFSMKG